jgi:hypothetical protein
MTLIHSRVIPDHTISLFQIARERASGDDEPGEEVLVASTERPPRSMLC